MMLSMILAVKCYILILTAVPQNPSGVSVQLQYDINAQMFYFIVQWIEVVFQFGAPIDF